MINKWQVESQNALRQLSNSTCTSKSSLNILPYDYMGYAGGHDDPARYTNDSAPTLRDAAGVLIERSYPIDFKWQDPRPYHNAPNSF